MSNIANDPNRISWINVPSKCDFPIQNIPFGVFLTRDDIITIKLAMASTTKEKSDDKPTKGRD